MVLKACFRQTDRQTDKSFINRRTDPRLQSRELIIEMTIAELMSSD